MTRLSECICKLTGSYAEIATHIARVGVDHHMSYVGERVETLGEDARAASLGWAMAHRGVRARANALAMAETALAEANLRGGTNVDAHRAMRDAISDLHAAIKVEETMEDRWRMAARALLDEMEPMP